VHQQFRLRRLGPGVVLRQICQRRTVVEQEKLAALIILVVSRRLAPPPEVPRRPQVESNADEYHQEQHCAEVRVPFAAPEGSEHPGATLAPASGKLAFVLGEGSSSAIVRATVAPADTRRMPYRT
jgi:hypothetical protein